MRGDGRRRDETRRDETRKREERKGERPCKMRTVIPGMPPPTSQAWPYHGTQVVTTIHTRCLPLSK